MVTANDLLCEIILTFNLVLFESFSARVFRSEGEGINSAHAGKTELNWCDKNLCSKKRTEGKFVGICYRICRDKFRDFHKVSLKTGPKPV